MNKLRFLPLFTVCFCLGIFLMKWIRIPFVFLYGLTWIFLIFCFIYTNSIWPLCILTILTGGLFLSNTYVLPFPHIRNFTFCKSEPVTIRGTVTDYPLIQPNESHFVLSARELTWAGKIYPVCGKVLARIFRKENVSYADELILEGRLYRPYQNRNSRFSYEVYLEGQGIYSILAVNKNKPIKQLGKAKVNPLKSIAYKIRNESRNLIFDNLNPMQAGILSAMILGDRSRISPQLRRLFIQTGTMHILAISGLHVGIVAFILDLFLKVLGLRRRQRYLLIIFLLVFYCFLTGARPSVIRATIMATVLLLGFLLKREMRISQSLAIAALIVLMTNPRQLFNAGFQLSFISVISIAYLSPLIKRLFDTDCCGYSLRIAADSNKSVIKRFFISGFSVSLAACLGVLPFVAYYFRIISPVTVLANLVVVPYLGLVIALGFCLLIVGIAFPALVGVFVGPANLSIVVLILIVKFFNQLPWAYFYI